MILPCFLHLFAKIIIKIFQIMKKLFLLLFIVCGSLLSSAEERWEIPIQDEPKPAGDPRTPYFGNDIMAYYQNGVVYLQFTYDMGEVEITVTNESTGDVWQQTEDSAFGSASITTSTSAGDYYITIVTLDGSCYSGSFSL